MWHSLGAWVILLYCIYLGDADTAAGTATEDGEGGWKTTEALPWEDSDRDYTYEEVPSLATIVFLIITHH